MSLKPPSYIKCESETHMSYAMSLSGDETALLLDSGDEAALLLDSGDEAALLLDRESGALCVCYAYDMLHPPLVGGSGGDSCFLPL